VPMGGQRGFAAFAAAPAWAAVASVRMRYDAGGSAAANSAVAVAAVRSRARARAAGGGGRRLHEHVIANPAATTLTRRCRRYSARAGRGRRQWRQRWGRHHHPSTNFITNGGA